MNSKKAIAILKKGGVVILPTDTNYNVFTRISAENGVKRIFNMKKRNTLSPLSLCFDRSQDVSMYADISPSLKNFIHAIWPASISFIVYKKITVPDYVTCGFPTVAIACHQHPILTEIIRGVGEPLAGTSANLSGTGLVKDFYKAFSHIGHEVDWSLNTGTLPSSGSNTMVDFSFEPPVLARAGDFSTKTIKHFFQNLQTHYSEEEYKTCVKKRFFNIQENTL